MLCNSLLLCQCAFEANSEIIIRAFKYFRFDYHLVSGTAHDCDAILYVIENLQTYNDMVVRFDNCGISENQIKTLTKHLANKPGELQVKSLDVTGNRLTDTVVMNLFQRASAAFCSLQYLLLGYNQIGIKTIKSITSSSISSLTSLDLSHNSLGVPGLQALGDAVCSGKLANLRTLRLRGSLTNDENSNRAFIEALSTNCPLLTEVNFSENDLNSPSVIKALARVVSSGSQIESIIIISESRLEDSGFNTFVQNLKNPCHIRMLQAKGNGIHGSSLSCLADVVYSEKIIFCVDDSYYDDGFCLDDNPLGLEGTIAVGRMVSSSHYQSNFLSLSRCQLTTIGGNDICINIQSFGYEIQSDKILAKVGQYLTEIPQNSSITKLILDGNSFSGESIHILSSFLHLCPNLEFLSSNDCGLNSEDLQQLFEQLQVTKTSFLSPCCKLQHWFLRNNTIDNRGVSSLIDHLPSLFPKLGVGIARLMFEYYDSFRGNPIGYEMIKRFIEEIIEQHQVSVIHQKLHVCH